MAKARVEYPMARHRYNSNRHRVRKSGMEWAMPFDQWYAWWLERGVDKNVASGGITKDSLCMQVIDRNLPFTVDNIQLAAFGEGRKGIATRAKGKPRVHLRHHKDENIHKKFMPWHKARSQAHYRGEQWDLTFEQFCQMWTDDLWDLRGRKVDEYAMSRIDPEQPWNTTNALVAPRGDHLRRIRQQQTRK